MAFCQLVVVHSLEPSDCGVRGSSGDCNFYLLHPCLVIKDICKIFLAFDLSLEARRFYHSVIHWEMLVGILVMSAFLPHEANDNLL